MAKYYADRGFITINGFEAFAVKDINIDVDDKITQVDHMTKNYRGSGFKRGNRSVSISLGLDIPEKKAQLDLALVDPAKQVNLVCTIGGERHQAIDVVQPSFNLSASVGDAGKKINLVALDLVNEKGQAVNADIGL